MMQETVDIITTFISNCGFPIFVSCVMMAMYYKMNETLQQLTLAITTLTAKFDNHVDNVEGTH